MLEFQTINTRVALKAGVDGALVFSYIALQVLNTTADTDTEGRHLWHFERWWTYKSTQEIAAATGLILPEQVEKAAARLLSLGYIGRVDDDGGTRYTLTEEGCRFVNGKSSKGVAGALYTTAWQTLREPLTKEPE